MGENISQLGAKHAFFWDPSTRQMTDLDLKRLIGGENSYAGGINRAGQVVGSSETHTPGQWHAFVWNGGSVIELGTLGGLSSRAADAINDAGQVVGQADLPGSNSYHAFLWSDRNQNSRWDPGEMIDLKTLGGSESWALAINTAGQVVGWAETPGFSGSHAFLWSDRNANGVSDSGEMIDLGTLFAKSISVATGINSTGQVVGWSGNDFKTDKHAVLWSGGWVIDLQKQVPDCGCWKVLEYASSINDSGQICGYGVYHTGEEHAFLLKPDP